jgi:hypothetical protein
MNDPIIDTLPADAPHDDAHRIRAIAERFVRCLETGVAPPDLFTEDAFCDLSLPLWRVQAQGREALLALRRAGHPHPGRVPRWRCDATPRGFVLEIEERWRDEAGGDWYSREMMRAELRGDAIHELSVYCTGDWDARR